MAKAQTNPNSLKNLKAPWEPGKSANPGGRPKKRRVSEAYEQVLDLPIPNGLRAQLAAAGFVSPKDATMAYALAIGQVRSALTDATSAKEVREATEGKAPQRLEHSGPEGEPMQIEEVESYLTQRLLGKMK
jgi:hypothetical protein